MQKFLMIVGKGRLNLYAMNEEKRVEKQYIDGNPYFVFDINSAEHDISRLLEVLVDEYNLDTDAEVEFHIVDNEDAVYSDVVKKYLGERVIEWSSISEILDEVYQKLTRDKNLMIEEFGVNFDGKNYMKTERKLVKKGFSLLGYTLQEDNLLKYIE